MKEISPEAVKFWPVDMVKHALEVCTAALIHEPVCDLSTRLDCGTVAQIEPRPMHLVFHTQPDDDSDSDSDSD